MDVQPIGTVLRLVAYVALALVCWRAWRKESAVGVSGAVHPAMWLTLGMFFLCVGFAEYFGIAHAITDLGRTEARADGWYGERRSLQRMVIWGIALFVPLASVMVVIAAPKSIRRYLPAYVGSLALACFILIRGVSLHDVDAAFSHHRVGGVRLGDLFEIAGAILVISLIRRSFVAQGVPARVPGQSTTPPGC